MPDSKTEFFTHSISFSDKKEVDNNLNKSNIKNNPEKAINVDKKAEAGGDAKKNEKDKEGDDESGKI